MMKARDRDGADCFTIWNISMISSKLFSLLLLSRQRVHSVSRSWTVVKAFAPYVPALSISFELLIGGKVPIAYFIASALYLLELRQRKRK